MNGARPSSGRVCSQAHTRYLNAEAARLSVRQPSTVHRSRFTSSSALPVCLTIAGSDSGGGAGIQADLKTFAARGVFGTSAITCLTAQNPGGVAGIHAAPARFVALQIESVFDGFPVAAAKTGMLYSAAIVRAVVRCWRARGCAAPPLVVDPVMLATSGARLLRADAVRALIEELLPLAAVVTPNLPEAEALAGMTIRTPDGMAAAARRIHARCGCACVVKGGHLQSGTSVLDVLWDGVRLHQFRCPRVAAHETHGTGCVFSATLAAGLARGQSLPRATAAAQVTVCVALRRARPASMHWPLNLI